MRGGRAKIVRDGGGFKAEQLYFLSQLQNHHGGLVLVGDHVYGTGGGELLCIEFTTGKVAWRNRCVGKGEDSALHGLTPMTTSSVGLQPLNQRLGTNSGTSRSPSIDDSFDGPRDTRGSRSAARAATRAGSRPLSDRIIGRSP